MESTLTAIPEPSPGSFVEDKYTLHCNDGYIVWHVPNFISKFVYFYLKHGGKLSVTLSGERRYSHNWKQGGLELQADFDFFKP